MPDCHRRQLLIALGVLPLAGLMSSRAWAVSNRVRIVERDGYRYIEGNGIPDHDTGRFPNRGNPNSIQPQDYRFRVSLQPRALPNPIPIRMNSFGVAVNGVPFDPMANEFWRRDRRSGWQYEALSGKINLGLDRNNAHVQPNGAYHYHGLPTGLIESWSPSRHSALIGFAADGFPIYVLYGHGEAEKSDSAIRPLTSSYRLKSGTRPGGPGGRYDGTFVQDYEYIAGSGDLDECNGRHCVTPDYPGGTYAYFLTAEYPFIPRLYRGEPDRSFFKGPGRGGPSGAPNRDGQDGRRPPPGTRPRRPPPRI